MITLKEEQLEDARSKAKNYPDLVQKLKAIEIKGYVFEVASQIIIYRYTDETFLIQNHSENRNLKINSEFNGEKVKEAITNNQKGLTDFPTFLKEIAEAGIKVYDADFEEMVVSYYGTKNLHVEIIPQ